jgi:hypothetical protein
MVRAGTSLTIEVTGTAGSWWNPLNAFETENGIKADVRAALLPYMSVDRLDIDDRGISDVVEWDYRATLTVRPKADYGAADDVASLVAHAFYEATGYLPSATVGSGSQPPLQPPAFDPGAAGKGIVDAITNLLKGLQGTATLVIVGAVVLVVLVAKSGAVKVRV